MGRKQFLKQMETSNEFDAVSIGSESEKDIEMDSNDNESIEMENDVEDADMSKDETSETIINEKKEFTKNRLLLVPGRGISYRFRHLMNDLALLCPHAKKSEKFDGKSKLYDLNELAELSNCNLLMYFETRKQKDLYMWMSKTPNGPSVRFQVSNSN